MGFRDADRVKETTTTTGTGTYNLAGAAAGFRTFVDGVGNGNLCHYVCENGSDWEVGIGTITDATPDTLARTQILASSNAGAAVNWGAGTKNIFCSPPAADKNPRTRKQAGNHAITSVTATEITDLELTNLQPGTYVAQYFLAVQSATATVGLGFGINFTGTASLQIMARRSVTTGTTAASGALDDANTNAHQLVEGYAANTFSTGTPNLGPNTGGVATINVNNMVVIEVLIVVTAAGNLEIWHNSETATSTTVKAGSSVILTRIDD